MKKILFTLLSASFIGQAFANECTIDISTNDQMQFNTKEIFIDKSCPEVTINLNNTGSLPRTVMGHNVIVSKTTDKMAVASDALSAGLDNQHIKPDDNRVLVKTDVVGGGESTSTTFKTNLLTAGEDYSFYCTVPGHAMIMTGKAVVK